MPRVGFEPTISAGERPKTYALDRSATGIGYTKPVSLLVIHLNVLCAKHNFFPVSLDLALWAVNDTVGSGATVPRRRGRRGVLSGALELLRNVNRTVAKSRQLCGYGDGRVGEVE